MKFYADYHNGTSFVEISDYVEDFKLTAQVDIVKLHAMDYKGQTVKLRNAAGLGLAQGQFFRIRKQDPLNPGYTPVVFSGYIKDIKTKLKSGDLSIDVLHEVSHLKTVSIATDPPGNTYQERLTSVLPSGYSLQFMDATAASEFTNNIPMAVRITYSGLTYADLLHDCLMIVNAWEPAYLFYADVIDKKIRIYSSENTVTLDADNLIDIETTTERKAVTFYDAEAANDNLRGTGGLSPVLVKPRAGDFYVSEYKVQTADDLAILQSVEYSSTDYGVVVGISDDGTLKTYTTNKIIFEAE